LASHSAIKAFLSALFFLNSHFFKQNFFLIPLYVEQISLHDSGAILDSNGFGADGGSKCIGGGVVAFSGMGVL